ncbi:MAG: DUF3604 domain-containing protein [Candidatus Sumerlaeota bacterium]|nr:DUF3604 domain-containing protein [Candidatus Sumerlaeota bacterium]
MHSQYKPQSSAGDWNAFLESAFEEGRENLDFFPIVYYPAVYYATPEGLQVESIGGRDECRAEWEKINALVKKHHKPGRFVTFAGYEWNGDRTRWGDHNVFYFHDDQPLDLPLTIDELLANLRARKAIAIPHHTAYAPGQRSKDWDHHDESLSPFAEIFSGHGSSEGDDTPLDMVHNAAMGPRVSGRGIQDALARGYRLGIIASNDSGNGLPGRHGGGLMACYARELTRDALWEAFLARRVYGVTGDRMRLDFRINDHFMGEAFRAKGPVEVRARVTGTQAIDRIELIKNNRVVATHCHNGTWEPPARGVARLKVKVEHGWGPAARYGLKVREKRWEARLETDEARLLSVERCFTRPGQRIVERSDQHCSYALVTAPRSERTGASNTQSLVFELEGDLGATVGLNCGEVAVRFTLAELLAGSRCLPLLDEAEAVIHDQFGLSRQQVENADVFYHNAWKIRIHRAAPEAGYTAALHWTDRQLAPGRNFYYVRVSQLNGQYAWSSPIWVDC